MTISFHSILVVEDDANLKKTLTHILQQYSQSVTALSSISEAQSFLSQNAPELIIADYFLPDGQLPQLSPYFSNSTEVIAISGLASAEESFELAKMGISQFISKPFDLERLEQVLINTHAKRSGQPLLCINTFGGLTIAQQNKEVGFGKKRPYRLLALLKAIIAFGGSNAPVHKICDWLWGNKEGDALPSNFHTSVHRLRQLLGPSAIIHAGNTVSLNNDIVMLDIWYLEKISSGRATTVDQISVDHFKQPWLPEDDSYWLIEPRQKYQTAAEKLFTS